MEYGVFYLLNLTVLKRATVGGCTDSIAHVVIAKYLKGAELYTQEGISAVSAWLEISELTSRRKNGGAPYRPVTSGEPVLALCSVDLGKNTSDVL